MSDESLVCWVVYERPVDFPHCFLARKHLIRDGGHVPTDDIMACTAIEPIRQQLQALGLFCITRADTDEPQIVETWI